MRKDFADLFAAERQGAKKRLDVLKDRAVDGLELAIDEIPDIASKRKKLHHIKKHIFPLVLRRLEALAPPGTRGA